MPAADEPAVVLGSDYGATSPFWNVGRNLDIASLGLDETLAGQLLAWQRYFDAHFRYDRESGGWDAAESADWYAREGQRLYDEVVRALPDRTVTLDLWPVTGAEPSI